VSSAVDTGGANALPVSLGATTTGGGLAAFNAFGKGIICSRLALREAVRCSWK
jgi:hypothetical protein